MVKEEFTLEEGSAPFNMALATLYALRNILADIKNIYSSVHLTDSIKQKLKVDLVKKFYVDASPLLDEDVVKKFESVLDLKASSGKVIENGRQTQRDRVVYDPELEKKMDSILIEIQAELQKKKYFMPPMRDKGSAVGF